MKKVFIIASIIIAGLGFGLITTSAPTSARVHECTTTTAVINRPLLRYGDRGTCVKELQRLLSQQDKDLGHYGVDGIFGRFTYAAVRSFQKEKGLEVDGLVGQNTWGALLDGNDVDQYAPLRKKGYDERYGPNYTNRVVISFDGCPRSIEQFNQVIETAYQEDMTLLFAPDQKCAKGTTFSVEQANLYGHLVMGHGTDHNTPLTHTDNTVNIKLVDEQTIVSGFMRPPHATWSKEAEHLLSANKLEIWTFTADTRDWATNMSVEEIASRVRQVARRGGTVMLNAQRSGFSKEGIKAISTVLNENGMKACNAYPEGHAPVKIPGEIPCYDGSVY